MDLRRRVSFVPLVVLLPPLVMGLLAVSTARRAYEARTHALLRTTAEVTARLTQATLDGETRTLAALVAGSAAEPTSGVDHELLARLYGVVADVQIAATFNAKGEGIASTFSRVEEVPARAAHPAIGLESMQEFTRQVTPLLARAGDTTLGEPYPVQDHPFPILPVVVRRAESEQGAVGIGLSLRSVCERVSAGGEDVEILLLDGRGRVLCGRGVRGMGEADPGLRGVPVGNSPSTYRSAKGETFLAARAAQPGGWAVIAQLPLSAATGPLDEAWALVTWGLVLSVLLAVGATVLLWRTTPAT